MKPLTTSIKGVVLLEPRVFQDERGWFMEFFKDTAFGKLGLPTRFLQDNFSESRRGVIRGLHFQVAPFAQGKLVTCIGGAVLDVVVDLRPDSPTFGKWHSVELSGNAARAVYVPEGLAHGFQALEDGTRLFYKCTTVYSRQHEQGIAYNDPELNITWPITPPIVSPKDLTLPSFKQWKSQHCPKP